jgi:hypothetical protein
MLEDIVTDLIIINFKQTSLLIKIKNQNGNPIEHQYGQDEVPNLLRAENEGA